MNHGFAALADRACVIRKIYLRLFAWTMNVMPCFFANVTTFLFARMERLEFCDLGMRLSVLTHLLVIGSWLAQFLVCGALMMLLWTVYPGLVVMFLVVGCWDWQCRGLAPALHKHVGLVPVFGFLMLVVRPCLCNSAASSSWMGLSDA